MSRARKSKIVLLTGNSLCHNPRVLKAASALACAGHEVQVLGGWTDSKFKARDRQLLESAPFKFVPVIDSTLPGMSHDVARFARRAGRRAVNEIYLRTGRQSPLQLGFGIKRFFRLAFEIPADLYVAHSEAGLYIASELARSGKRVGVDMEDWFSEDLLPEARRYRPLALLRSLESKLLLKRNYASCPSRAMSGALADAYGCAPLTVVYNAFEWSERRALDGSVKDRRNKDIPSIHWFSTTLGHGRGLDKLLAAIPLLKYDVEIHLRGKPSVGFEAWVKTQVPNRWRDRVFIHPVVRNDELLARIVEHDIGFAGETKECLSRDLTITNKVLHYLLGGLAVVASDTAGQKEVAEQAPGAVLLYAAENVRALADVLNGLLGSPERMRQAKAAALQAAKETFCWERQEAVLLEAFERTLRQPMAVG
jgi:glycosyltransferase involved in cell wall biosynthesis